MLQKQPPDLFLLPLGAPSESGNWIIWITLSHHLMFLRVSFTQVMLNEPRNDLLGYFSSSLV